MSVNIQGFFIFNFYSNKRVSEKGRKGEEEEEEEKQRIRKENWSLAIRKRKKKHILTIIIGPSIAHGTQLFHAFLKRKKKTGKKTAGRERMRERE